MASNYAVGGSNPSVGITSRVIMRKTHIKFNIVGITPEGVHVVDNVFRIFDTDGLPLDELFYQCKEHNLMPSWINFYEDARLQGWSHKTIMNRLEVSIRDVYGKEFSDGVLERLQLYSELT